MEYKPIGRASESSEVPRKHCTDLFCCILFTIFASVFLGVASYGLNNGDPDLIRYPFDVSGNQCGRPGTETSDYKYLYYVSPDYPAYTVCVQDCSSPCATYNSNIWVTACVPGVGFVFRVKETGHSEYALEYPANGFLNRFCVPDKKAVKEAYEIVSGKIHDGDAFEWAQDLAYCWDAFILVLGVSLLLSLVYMVLLRMCTWLILMASIAGVVAILVGLGYYVKIQADANYDASAQSTEHQTMVYLSYACYCLSGLFLIIIFFMWRRIQLAVAILKCSLDFMGEVCSILLIPLLSFLVTAGLVCFWVFALAFLYSCGTVEQKDQYSSFGNVTWDQYTRDLFYFEAVGFVWIVEFELLFTQLVLALVVSYWYFDHNSSRQHHRKVCLAIWTAFRYHIGSVAFASLVLTLVKLVKWVLYYLQKRVYDQNFAGNQAVKLICGCVGCYVACFERFIQFVDKNALIAMAYSSSTFCQCAEEVFGMLANNAARFVALGSVGELVSLVGKGVVMAGSAFIGFLVLTHTDQYSSQLTSPVPATIVFVLIAYCVSSLFLSVFEMTCDCIIVFYIEDEKRSGDNKSRMHAPAPLHEFMSENRSGSDSMCCCWV